MYKNPKSDPGFASPPEKNYFNIQESPIWHDEKGAKCNVQAALSHKRANRKVQLFVPIVFALSGTSDCPLTSSLLILGVFLMYLHSDSAYSKDHTYSLFLTATIMFKIIMHLGMSAAFFVLKIRYILIIKFKNVLELSNKWMENFFHPCEKKPSKLLDMRALQRDELLINMSSCPQLPKCSQQVSNHKLQI